LEILVTGAGGFVGKHLLSTLEKMTDVSLHGTLLNESERELISARGSFWSLDLCNAEAVRNLIGDIRPDRIFHLAGQAYVPRSFEAPWETLENNIRGALNLLQAVYELKLPTRLLIIGSAEVYGTALPDRLPLTEESPFMPSSPYSVSKIAQDMLAYQYTRAHGVFTVRTRPFNHIGPGQNARFAASDWAQQIAQAEAGQREAMVEVGNLTAARDFTDVRDVVRAYILALEKGQPGDVFNVCSGRAYSMQYILDTLLSFSTVPIEVRSRSERFRPVEIPVLYGDYQRLHQATGWQPELAIEQSLLDVLNEWRQRVKA
jgi:GDP-4-dehydro-6-deoxy-D-mannose reductase